MIVWFTTHANRQRRPRWGDQASIEPADGTAHKRPRLLLPIPGWLQLRFARHQIDAQDSGDKLTLEPCLQGLLLLQPRRAWSGVLFSWSAEAEVLWKYEGRPCNAYEADVRDCVYLKHSVPCFAGHSMFVSGGGGVKSPSHLNPFLPLISDELWETPCFGKGMQRGSVRDVLLEWRGRIPDADPESQLPCISIVDPVMQLIKAGDWRDLVLLSLVGGWRQCVDPCLPPAFAATVSRPDIDVVDLSLAELSPAFLLEHIQALRRWSEAIIQHDADSKPMLEDHVKTFEQIALSLTGGHDAVSKLHAGVCLSLFCSNHKLSHVFNFNTSFFPSAHLSNSAQI